MKKIVAILCAALLAAAVFMPVSAVETKDAVGMNVSNFSGTDLLTGEPVTGAMLGNAVCNVINEWATWCGPCVNEMPHFMAMHEYYSSTPELDVQIFGSVYYSNGCNASTAAAFLTQNGYTWPNIGEDSVLAAVFNNSNAIPNTIIVDRHGVVRHMTTGSFPSSAALQEYIEGWYETLLEEEGPIGPAQPVWGDADGNGVVDLSDALMALRYAMGLIDSVPGLDYIDGNNDGTVDISDALIILRIAMGLMEG